MSAPLVGLIVYPGHDANQVMKATRKAIPELEKLLEDRIKLDFEEFEGGTRRDTYDYVIFALLNEDLDKEELEMQEDMYNFYGEAPVVAWVYNESKDFASLMKESHKKCPFKDAASIGDAVILAIKECKALRHAKANGDVKKAFDKFDKDMSGNIDKEELGELSKELGYELSEEQLTSALGDLDLNGNGVIDFDEFCRWYFTGMKPFNGLTRSMLKIEHGSKTLFNTLADKMKESIGGDLTTRQHSIKLGFNAPETVGTHLELSIHPVGSYYNQVAEELKVYHDTWDEEKYFETKRWGEEDTYQKERFAEQTAYLNSELSFTLKNASENAAKLSAVFKKFHDNKSYFTCATPIFKGEGDKLKIGLRVPVPMYKKLPKQMLTIPQEIQLLFAGIDQYVKASFDLKASIKDIWESNVPLAENISQGMQAGLELNLVANLKTAILQGLESEESQQYAMVLGMAAPVFMLGLNANVNLTFDDFDSIKSHPMAGPGMVSFSDLFEGVLGQSKEDALGSQGSLDAHPLTEEDNQDSNTTKIFYELFTTLITVLEGDEVTGMEVKLHIPELAVIDFKIESEGLGVAIGTGLLATIYKPLLRELSR